MSALFNPNRKRTKQDELKTLLGSQRKTSQKKKIEELLPQESTDLTPVRRAANTLLGGE